MTLTGTNYTRFKETLKEEIIYYESLPESWLVIIIGLFLLYSGFIIWKHRDQWVHYTILFFIRSLVLTLIILYYYKPAMRVTEEKKYYPSIPVFIDQSFSMNSDLYLPNQEKQRIPKYQYYRDLIDSRFLNSKAHGGKWKFELYQYRENKQSTIDGIHSLKRPYGFFNVNDWFNHLKQTSDVVSSFVILVSDLNIHINTGSLKGLKKQLYVVYEEETASDLFIDRVTTERRGDEKIDCHIHLSQLSNKPQKLEVRIEEGGGRRGSRDRVAKRNFLLTNNEDRKTITLKPFKKDKILSAVVKGQREEKNLLNNRFYFKLEGKEDKPTIHLIFQKPSFELSFLRRFLKRQQKYKVRLYMPTPANGPIKLKTIPSKDKVILGNMDHLNRKHVKILTDYLKKGGFIIFLKGSSSLRLLTSSPLAKLLPFSYKESKGISSLQSNNTLHISPYGAKFSFLNFRESEYQSIWDRELSIFSPVKGRLIGRNNSHVLATVHNKKAIFFQKRDRGTIIAILAGPIWKLDFYNMHKSFRFLNPGNYYDQFWEDLLKVNEIQQIRDHVGFLNDQKVYVYGEKVTIYFPKKENKQLDNIYIRVKDGKKWLYMKIKPIDQKDRWMAQFSCRYLGENQIVRKAKLTSGLEKEIAKFYVNYPNDKESFQLDNETRKGIAMEIADKTGGKVLNIKQLEGAFSNIKQEVDKVIHETSLKKQDYRILYLMLIAFLLSLEWGIKRLFLGK